MRVYEIKEDCYDNVLGIVKKIVKCATDIEDELEASELGHRMRREYDDEDDMKGRYKGMKYSRY